MAHADPGASLAPLPRRHAFAWVLALLVPHLGAGNAASAAPLLVIAMVGVISAIAIPNFVRFQQRAQAKPVAELRALVQARATQYIDEHRALPGSLTDLGLPETLGEEDQNSVTVTSEGFVFQLAPRLHAGFGERFALTPYVENGKLLWSCGEGSRPEVRSLLCDETPGAPGSAQPQSAAAQSEDAEPSEEAEPESVDESAQGELADEAELADAPLDALSGRWRATSEGEGPLELSFGTGNSVVLSLGDQGTLLATYRRQGDRIAVSYRAGEDAVVVEYELVSSGNRTLLRPLAGGPFYVRS
jgi:competence protein ComGC